MTDFNFPAGLFFVFGVIAIFFISYRLFYFRKKTLNKFFSKDIQEEILVPRSKVNFWIKVALICLAWICLTFSLMQPRGDARYALEGLGRPLPIVEKIAKKQPHDVILLIDASRSMELKDTETDAGRLEYAKEIGDEIISGLRGETIAIEAFTSVSTNISPSTNDYLFARLMLRKIGINEGEVAGTNIFEAMAGTIKKYLSYQSPKLTSIILLSDGGDTALYKLKKDEREKKLGTLLNLIDNSAGAKLKIFTIGLGSLAGGPIEGVLDSSGNIVTSSLDEQLLRKISRKTGGSYYFANDYPAYLLAAKVIKEIENQENLFKDISDGKTSVINGKEDLTYDLFFQYPLGLAIFLLAFAYFFPDTKFLMKTLPVLIFFSVIDLNLSADDLEVKTNQAAMYMEALEFDQAKNIFNEIKVSGLENWQKNRLLYNIGTIKLAQNSLEEAYRQYIQIPVQPKFSPYLTLRLKTNMATALYKQAKKEETLSLEALSKVIDLYFEALFNVHIAESANCYLNELLGREGCYPIDDLLKLKSAIKRGLAAASIKYESLKISEFTAKDALPYLLVGIKQILQDINFLQSENMSEELKKKFLNLFINNMESNFLLWQVLEGDVYDFEKAEVDFTRGLKYMKEERLGLSSLMFMGSYVELMKIMYESYGVTPIVDLLQKLDIAYQRTLLQMPIQSQSLNLILHEQKRVARIIDTGVQEIQISIKYLQDGINFTLKRKNREAAFRVQAARFWLNIPLQKIRTSEDDLVKETIKKAIFNQELAFSLNQLTDKMENVVDEDFNIILRAQDYTVKEAFAFFDIVLRIERAEYKKACREKPWDRVVPLFEKGYNAAKNSYDKKIVSKNLQAKALSYWKSALNQLREKEEIKKEPLKPIEEGQEDKKMVQILNLLRKMEKDDHLPAKRTKRVKEGRRSW